MKHSVFIFIFSIVCSVILPAQKIRYESSFEKAKSLALQQKKPLAVLITITPPVSVNVPDFMKGLNNEKVIATFNNNFINYKVEREDTTASGKIIRDYKIYRFPSFIFFDSNGGLLFTDIAYLSMAQALLDVAQRAISTAKEMSLASYDSSYATGENSIAFLKEYIIRREKAGITDNADLIEKYVLGLKVSDFYNYNEVLFILKAGPMADGNAYKLASLNKQLIDSIFKKEPQADRVAINNCIITNTLNNAISQKNFNRAMAAANYTRGTWTSNSNDGQKNYTLNILRYYKGICDTTRYLQQASGFYEQYYMRLTVDSVRKRDSLNFVRAMKNAREISSTQINDSVIRRVSSFTYTTDSFATELNNAAWVFYQMAYNKSDYLFKAMLWSRRSFELTPKPGFYDTYAHLLYRLKIFDLAESAQKKAIELAKAEKTDTKLYEEEYEKIRKRIL
jgi:hypothetical protein